MEFLVEFKVNVPAGASESEVNRREAAEASAAAEPTRPRPLVSTAPTAKRSSAVFSTLSRSATGCTSPSPRWSPIPTIR
jgi:hypothetical protein